MYCESERVLCPWDMSQLLPAPESKKSHGVESRAMLGFHGSIRGVPQGGKALLHSAQGVCTRSTWEAGGSGKSIVFVASFLRMVPSGSNSYPGG